MKRNEMSIRLVLSLGFIAGLGAICMSREHGRVKLDAKRFPQLSVMTFWKTKIEAWQTRATTH